MKNWRDAIFDRIALPPFSAVPARTVPNACEALRFARDRGYAVCYRTDTGKPHIGKPRRKP